VWRLEPRVAIRVSSPALAVVSGVTCTMTTRAAAGYGLVTGDGTAVDDAFSNVATDTTGYIQFPVLGISGEYAADGGRRSATIVITCTRTGGSPPPISFDVSIAAPRMAVCAPPTPRSTSQTALPPITVAIALAGGNATGNASTAAACSSALSTTGGFTAWPAVTCRIAERALTAGSNGTAGNATASNAVVQGASNAVVQGASITIPTSAPLVGTFTQFAVSGTPDSSYGMRLTCAMAEVTVPAPLDFAVFLEGCAVGQQTSGIFCVQCGVGNFSLGGTATRGEYKRCVSCPPTGADCAGGRLALLPDYYRPIEHVRAGLPFSGDSELWPCFNGEACLVFNTTDNATHACAPGYTGALCGVCDAAGGFGKFGEVCRPCWSRAASEAFLAAVILVVSAVLLVMAVRKRGAKSPASIALKILLSFLQVRAWEGGGGEPLFAAHWPPREQRSRLRSCCATQRHRGSVLGFLWRGCRGCATAHSSTQVAHD
jgi:hypothetical protein